MRHTINNTSFQLWYYFVILCKKKTNLNSALYEDDSRSSVSLITLHVTVLCQHHCHLSGRSSRCFMSLRTDSRTSLEDWRTQTRYHACSWMFVKTHPNLDSPRRCAAYRLEKSAAGQSHGRTCTLFSAGGGAFQNELHGHTDPAERVSEAPTSLFYVL